LLGAKMRGGSTVAEDTGIGRRILARMGDCVDFSSFGDVEAQA
jgi:hypothetical protein